MSASGRGRVTLAVLLAVCGGVATAGGSLAPWARFEHTRDVGGVPMTEVETVSGMSYAPRLLPLGLAAALAGLALLLVRGRLQQGVAVAVTACGLAGCVLVVLGVGNMPPDAAFGAGVALAGFGALGMAGAGALALRPAAPARLPDRYDLDADDGDDEWDLASDDETGP